MDRSPLTAAEVKAAILDEPNAMNAEPLDPRDIVLLGGGESWRPDLRRQGRVDEAQLAVVCKVGLRLAKGYDLAS